MQDTSRINFTHRALDSLQLPLQGKRATYFDEKVQNLNIIVTHAGAKSFYVRKNINGQSKRIRLGGYPELSVENARVMAMEVKTVIAKGEDPFEMRQSKKHELTMNDMFEVYLERHARPHKKTASMQMDIRNYNYHIKRLFGNRRLSAISQNDIANLHAKIGAEKPYMANRILALLNVIFNKSLEWKMFKSESPTFAIKPFKEKSRDRFLQPEEFSRFFESLDQEVNHSIRDYVYLSLFTGARQGNILAMRWDELNFEQALWRVEDTKNGEVQMIPLIEEALILLQKRKKQRDVTSPFVFVSHGKTGHMVEPKKGWRRILDRAGIENLRLHDLRRTLGSYQAINGTSLHIIGKSLGHKSLTATQVYSRLTDDPVRDSMSEAVKSMRGWS